MWLFAGFSAWLTEEAADSTDAFTLLFSFHPRSVTPNHHHLHSLLNDQVSFCPSVWKEMRRREGGLFWSMAGNQTMGRRETDRPHNLPTYQHTAITYLSLSIYFLLISVFNSHTQSALLKQSPDTQHTNMHLTANMLQKTHYSTQLWALICQHSRLNKERVAFPLGWMDTYLPVSFGRMTNNI